MSITACRELKNVCITYRIQSHQSLWMLETPWMTCFEVRSAHPIPNVVALDGVSEEQQASGVVDCQRPEDLGWKGELESDGVCVSIGGIQDLATGIPTCLVVYDLTGGQRGRNKPQILCRDVHLREMFPL